MFNSLLNQLSKGLSVNEGFIFRKEITLGRTNREHRLILYFKNNTIEFDLMNIIIFHGIQPWYHPWIEIMYPYDIKNKRINQNEGYFNSPIEKKLMKTFCTHLPPAGKIFVSYEQDDETRKGLMINIPPMITRLGVILFNNGCTWFKDWYFPEGGLEGGQKLQGEKPLSQQQKNRQLQKIEKQIIDFLSKKKNKPSPSVFEKKAVERADYLLQDFFS